MTKRTREDAYWHITQERERQDARWGSAESRHLPLALWHLVLDEEVGEVAKAILQGQNDPDGLDKVRRELTQVAAVAVCILEALAGRDELPPAEWGLDRVLAG